MHFLLPQIIIDSIYHHSYFPLSTCHITNLLLLVLYGYELRLCKFFRAHCLYSFIQFCVMIIIIIISYFIQKPWIMFSKPFWSWHEWISIQLLILIHSFYDVWWFNYIHGTYIGTWYNMARCYRVWSRCETHFTTSMKMQTTNASDADWLAVELKEDRKSMSSSISFGIHSYPIT